MYSWRSLQEGFEIACQSDSGNPNAGIRFLVSNKDKFLADLSNLTGRNTILYFSAFMQKASTAEAIINDKDINALMENVHKLDRSKGLDVILHTPGGDLAATEHIITYLRSAFNGDIRAIIPQMAMSAGSMIAVSCKAVVMGRQSCLGPFDPQLNGVPCQSVVKEFYKAVNDVSQNPASLGLWQSIISKLTPTFITQCEQADKLASELTEMILADKGLNDQEKAQIKTTFCKNSDSKIHNRHISRDKCKASGLNVIDLEQNQTMQDLVLGIHHCCMILGDRSNILKIVQNNIGGCYITHVPSQAPAKV